MGPNICGTKLLRALIVVTVALIHLAGMISRTCIGNTWDRFVFAVMLLTFIAQLVIIALRRFGVPWQPYNYKFMLPMRYTVLGVCYIERLRMLRQGYTAAIIMLTFPGAISFMHCYMPSIFTY